MLVNITHILRTHFSTYLPASVRCFLINLFVNKKKRETEKLRKNVGIVKEKKGKSRKIVLMIILLKKKMSRVYHRKCQVSLRWRVLVLYIYKKKKKLKA